MTRRTPHTVNRRKRVSRRHPLLRWLRPHSNCRVPQEADGAPPRRRRVLAQVKHGLVATARAVTPVAILASMGGLGYLGGKHILAAGTFDVRRLEVEGFSHLSATDLAQLSTQTDGLIFKLDVDQLERDLRSHPWVDRADIQRQLPDTLKIAVSEHRAKAVLAMQHLYLVNEQGQVFKRADLEEAADLPVITGIERRAFTAAPDQTHAKLKRALAALSTYHNKTRPRVGEVHVSAEDDISLFLDQGGAALHFGDGVTEKRLGQLDRVWASLGPKTKQARAVFLDNRVRGDRVVVRMTDDRRGD